MKKIILVVGASGAGKDSLLKAARNYFKNNPKVHFIRRYITRKPGSFEENYFVDEDAFEILKNQGFFVSFWYAHGNKYGVPKKELDRLREDEVAVISISREKITDFENRFGEKAVTLHITADKDIIEKRLKERSRETSEQIESRIKRMNHPVEGKNIIQFDNNPDLEISSKAFNHLLEKINQNAAP